MTVNTLLEAVQDSLNYIVAESDDTNVVEIAADAIEELDRVLDAGPLTGMDLLRTYHLLLEYGPEPLCHDAKAYHLDNNEMRDVLEDFRTSDWDESGAYYTAGKYGIDSYLVPWIQDIAREAESEAEFYDAIEAGYDEPNYPTPTQTELVEAMTDKQPTRIYGVDGINRMVVQLTETDLDTLEEQGWVAVGNIIFCHSKAARDVCLEHGYISPLLTPHDLRDRYVTNYPSVLSGDTELLVEYIPDETNEDDTDDLEYGFSEAYRDEDESEDPETYEFL